MDTKGKVAVGVGALALLGLVGVSVAKAQASKPITVTVKANPIRTVMLVDNREVPTPATIQLSPGVHRFAVVSQSPDLVVLYGFHKWQANGRTVGYDPTVTLKIVGPTVLTAQYIIKEAGRYPIIQLA